MIGEMADGFVTVNGVPTQVFTWGGWIEDTLNQDEVVIFIPGSPGIIGYYYSFLSKLHSQLGVPVWAVAFSGHAIPPKSSKLSLPTLEENPHLYLLQGQIDHKMAFIEKFVPEGVKITIVSHSIGTKLTLEVLKKNSIRSKVKQAYLLFPTIERMAESPNGKLMMSYMKYSVFVSISMFLIWIFNFIPVPAKKFIIAVTLILRGIPVRHLAPTLQYMDPTVMKNVASLALDNMEKVKELDSEAMEEFSDILFLYYGMTDGWVPLEYCDDIKRNYPKVKCVVCERKIDHAFCLTYGDEMALILSDQIKKHQQQH